MRKILIGMFILIGCGIGIYLYFNRKIDDSSEQSTSLMTVSEREIPSLETLIVQVDDVGNHRILSCSIRGCDSKQPPSSIESQALSDGQSWYRYRDREGERGKPIRVLEKVDMSGETQTITEESPLVRPRDIIMSTDGTKIAYFLDNVHDASGLTELWVYDSVTGGTKVVAENLRKADIASRVRWNASSRALWFLMEEDEQELNLIPLSGTTALPAVHRIPWTNSESIVDEGVMDISDDATRIAHARSTFPGFSQLVVTHTNETSPPVKKTLKGTVAFVRWMHSGALFYAVQNSDTLTFWMAEARKEWPIARMKAMFESAHSTGSLDIAAFIADPREEEPHLFVLDIATGLVKDQMALPTLRGASSHLVQANEAAVVRDEAVASITNQLPDAAITEFIQKNIGNITAMQSAHAIRVITTDSANTVYVDYREHGFDAVRRILVTVQDAVYPSWKVLASYGADPNILKVYEWEEDVSQWILKKTY